MIGSRPGEKRDEVLLTAAEALSADELADMYVVSDGAVRSQPVRGGQGDEALLDRAQVRELIDAAGWLRPESLPSLG